MSSTCEGNVTEESTLDIENILADFFLKKFNMSESQSDKSDSNCYERRCKSKHKKHKQKKSKYKHKRSKDHSTERESIVYEKKEILDNSSSEEKEIKRLKKIKQLESRNNKLWVPSNAIDIASVNAVQNIPNAENCSKLSNDLSNIPYGPSIELLLTGTDNAQEENAKPVIGLDALSIPIATINSNIENNGKENDISNNALNLAVLDEISEKSIDHNISSVHSTECEGNTVPPIEDETLCSREQLNKNFCHKSDLQEQYDDKVLHKKHSRCRLRSQDKQRSFVKSHLRSRSQSKTWETSKYESSSSSRNRKYVDSHLEYRAGRRTRSRSRSRRSRSNSRKWKDNNTHRREHSDSERCTRSKSGRYSRSRSKEIRKKSKCSESRINISNKKERSYSSSSEECSSKSHISRSRDKKYSYKSCERSNRSRSGSPHVKRKTSNKSEESADWASDSRLDVGKQSHSKSREENPSSRHKKIDQAKILEFARQKLKSMIETDTLPEGLSLQNFKKEELASIKAGGKSVQELTDFCVKLSKKENEADIADGAATKDEEEGDDDDDFIHHPFRLKEPSVLKLNIKNAIQIPVKTHAEKVAETARLSSQFPVSSGNQHKQKELEWIPVEPEKSKPDSKSNTLQITVPQNREEPNVQTPKLAVCEPASSEPIPSNVDLPLIPIPTEISTATLISSSTSTPVFQATVQPVPMQSSSNCSAQASSVFKPPKFLDIASIVSKRFKALIKIQENPNDQAALNELQEAQSNIQEWVQSQQVPGQFTGSTDAKLLTVEELCGPRNFRMKRDLFARAAPVTEGKGMSLLKKMGWNPGEGLGKNKEGSLEPLVLNIKMDKKGLVSEEEDSKKQTVMKDLQGKHPVSALMELCSKRKWKPPLYTVVLDVGPPHKKLFLFKVEVNGTEYQPVNPCSNKKQAKAETACLCLQALNVFPKRIST